MSIPPTPVPPPTTPSQSWWDPGVPNEGQRARYSDQVEAMIRAFELADHAETRRGVKVWVYPDTGDLADTRFIYRTDALLLLDSPEGEAAVYGVLGRTVPAPDDPRRPRAATGVTTILLDPDEREFEARAGTRSQVEMALEDLRKDPATEGLRLTFDALVHLAAGPPQPSSSACPAIEPVPAWGPPVPSVACDRELGTDVRVAVIDTGWPDPSLQFAAGHWLHDVTGDTEDILSPGHYRGHGLFVAGVVRTMAPSATVYVHNFIFTAGGRLASDLAPLLEDVLTSGVDVISMSAGTVLTLPDGVVPPDVDVDLAEARLAATFDSIRSIAADRDTLLVFAAGNNANDGPFVPASLPWADAPASKVAVGALDQFGMRAGYSNFGPWVDVYARGTDMVNAYPVGWYQYEEAPLKGTSANFTSGMAGWSGTSFATPLVAGLVAARKSWSGEHPKEAWASLKRIADAKAHDGMPVLDPGDADRGFQPPQGWTP